MVTAEDQRAALDAEGIAAMAAAGIPRASITSEPSHAWASSVLTATVRGHTVSLYAAGSLVEPLWFADAEHHGNPCLLYPHRERNPSAALKPVLRRIPKEAK